ncbi:hypothetical protein TcasGA2_TC034181 [Tribolium castaneum]|uniref:Uncharacterized protein n=1 Tax=Tribolium castaneum TaxID=7070 RepID=A0A139WCX5_TRICA|nr:hypothetical protein TcasGA2_TC034181 [Tribolium castaneum]
MIVQAVVLWEKILNVLLGIKMGRDTLHSRLPRSSSIDSMVEAVWAEEAAAEPVAAAEKRPSLRADRPLAIVSPSVGRRMKGQRGINGISQQLKASDSFKKRHPTVPSMVGTRPDNLFNVSNTSAFFEF